MKGRALLVLLGTLIPATAPAQEMAMQQMGHGDMAVSSARQLYEMTKDWLIKSAEQMPEANYSFKPTPEVRSFGQLMGHVANSQYMFCAPIKGEANPNKTDFEKTTYKAALVKAVQDAFAYCDGAYQMSDQQAMGQLEMFGMKGSKLWALMFNLAHDSEHYGNVVTYFRLKGLVPPSSQQGGM